MVLQIIHRTRWRNELLVEYLKKSIHIAGIK